MFSPEIRLVFLMFLIFFAALQCWLSTVALDHIDKTPQTPVTVGARRLVIRCLRYVRWTGIATLTCHIILLGSLLKLYPFGK